MNSWEIRFVLPRMSKLTKLIGILLYLILAAIPVKGEEDSDDKRPPVFLNHVMVYLDSTAYAAVGNSEFMKSTFSYCVEKNVTADGGKSSWTGTYVLGEHTFVEFFKILKPRNAGFSSLGFSVDVEGGG